VTFELLSRNLPKIVIGIALGLSGLFVASQLLIVTYAQEFSSQFYSPSDSPFGITYGEWIAKYWDWWANIPKSQTPTEVKYECFMHETGNVIFLIDPLKMNGDVSYSCKIPAGKALFFPLVTSEYDKGTEGYEQATDRQLIDAAKQDDNSNAFKVILDGKVISSEYLRSLRAESPFWNITIVSGNHYDSPPGVFRAVAEGFHVFLKPLSPGSHQLYFETSSPKSELQVSPGGRITYNLLVNSTNSSLS
jgi:hypothetical protein